MDLENGVQRSDEEWRTLSHDLSVALALDARDGRDLDNPRGGCTAKVSVASVDRTTDPGALHVVDTESLLQLREGARELHDQVVVHPGREPVPDLRRGQRGPEVRASLEAHVGLQGRSFRRSQA